MIINLQADSVILFKSTITDKFYCKRGVNDFLLDLKTFTSGNVYTVHPFETTFNYISEKYRFERDQAYRNVQATNATQIQLTTAVANGLP